MVCDGAACSVGARTKNFFRRLKRYRRVATRYEELAVNFFAMVDLGVDPLIPPRKRKRAPSPPVPLSLRERGSRNEAVVRADEQGWPASVVPRRFAPASFILRLPNHEILEHSERARERIRSVILRRQTTPPLPAGQGERILGARNSISFLKGIDTARRI